MINKSLSVLFGLCLLIFPAVAQSNKLTTTGTIPQGDLLIQGSQAGQVADGGKTSPGGVSSFNGRTGPVTPQAGDYSAFYAPLNPPITVSANTTLTSAQITSFTPIIATTPVILLFPATSTGAGGVVLETGGGAITVEANAADQLCSSSGCVAGGSLTFSGLGQVIWVFSDGKGHLWTGL